MFKFCPHCGFEISSQSKNEFECPNCGKKTHYASYPGVSVVVKVKNEILLVVRALDPGKGSLDVAGGFLENGEEPIDGAVREFQEEVGIDLNPKDLKFFGMWTDLYHYQDFDQYVLNIVYLLELSVKFDGKPSDDVSDLKWVSINSTPEFVFPWLYKLWENIRKSARIIS